MVLGGLHVHAKGVGMGEKRPKGLVQRLIDGNEAAEIFDTDLHVIAGAEIQKIVFDVFIGTRHNPSSLLVYSSSFYFIGSPGKSQY